jgi:hypothetical protein
MISQKGEGQALDYSDDYLRSVMPPERPPLDHVPVEVRREVAGGGREGRPDRGDLAAHSTYWTYAIFSEWSLGNVRVPESLRGLYPWASGIFPGYPPIAVGLFDPERETTGFGIVLNIPQTPDVSFGIVGELEFPRLERKFPFAVRTVLTELHAAPNPIKPAKATTACWAKCDKTGQWGVITAGHAIGSVAGMAIGLDDGTTGISHRCFWQPVDAAFVLTPSPSYGPALLPVIHFPAAGLAVEVECQTGNKSRTVAAACNSLGFFRTRQYPVNFFLDKPADAGDSGALVSTSSGEACGIYLGSQPSPDTGGTSGLALNFAQAMFALDTTPYR